MTINQSGKSSGFSDSQRTEQRSLLGSKKVYSAEYHHSIRDKQVIPYTSLALQTGSLTHLEVFLEAFRCQGISSLNLLLRSHCKSIVASLIFKPFEFDGFKIWIVKFFPESEKSDGFFWSHPVANGVIRVITSKFCDVCKRDKLIFEIISIDSNV